MLAAVAQHYAPSALAKNPSPSLTGTSYQQTLQALREPLRSDLLHGIERMDYGVMIVSDGEGRTWPTYVTRFKAGPFEAWSHVDVTLAQLTGEPSRYRAEEDNIMREQLIHRLTERLEHAEVRP